MRRRGISVGVLCAFANVASCSSDESPGPQNPGTGGSSTGGAAPSPTGGTAGGAKATGGTAPTGGAKATGGAPMGGTGTGGANAGMGGTAKAGAGGATGGVGGTAAGGSKAMGGAGGEGKGGGTSAGSGGANAGGPSGGANAMMNFFVTSDTSKTANLGGLAKADERCQALAAAVGAGSKTWRAYLSTEEPPLNARDRIGDGPYYNSKGVEIAASKDALHQRTGDAELFLDEKGARINGQWKGSPTPNEHDILTGTLEDGTVSKGNTCGDWSSTSGNSQVGHSDGLGPNMNSDEPYSIWNGSHTGQCGDTQPGGGSGRIYCFVGP
jgi:hypothetical protein